MAVFAATDYRIEINGVNMSTMCTSAELSVEADKLVVTAFGSSWESSIGGIKRATLSLSFNQDFAAAQVDALLWPLLGTTVPFKIRPTSGAISATNPEFQGNVTLIQEKPISAGVGELAKQSLTWPLSGTLTRAVA